MISEVLPRIADRQPLSREEAMTVMTEVLTGQCSPTQIAALLVGLRMKGETVEEIVGFAEAMRATAVTLNIPPDLGGDLVDTCGTGGDGCGSFNISTAAALVAAGAGVRVAKHGNRNISSKCGSADVLEALGVNFDLPPARLVACLEEIGFVFLFAPAMHPAMKHVQDVRRELKMRTVFNLLGPLTNPAAASSQVVGVYSLDLVDKVAEALSMLGLRRALVVHGLDGLDEITITGPTRIAEWSENKLRTYEVAPEDFALRTAPLDTIAGGDAAHNAGIIREVLAGERSPRRDAVLLNAAAALVASGKTAHLSAAIPVAAKSIDSGAAAEKLEALARFSKSEKKPRRSTAGR